MWNYKHLAIAILFAVCAIACAISVIFPSAGIIPSGFIFGGNGNDFAPTGIIVFTLFSIIFFRNARR